MSAKSKFAVRQKVFKALRLVHPGWGVHSHRGVTFLLLLAFGGIAVVGSFVAKDLRTANADAQKINTAPEQVIRRVAALGHDARETRLYTLFAMTTDDSNLQVEYADRTREADHRVTEGITEYLQQTRTPEELEVGRLLRRDWSHYINVRDEMLAASLEGNTREAMSDDLREGVPSFDRIDQDLEEIKRLYDREAAQRLANVAAASRRFRTRLVVFLGLASAFGIGSILVIQRSKMLNAQQLTKLQMEFVASVSHELRSPLAVISSAADNIVDGIVEGKEGLKRYGLVIRNQNRQMTELVDQILLFASTEDRKNRYALQPLQVAQIFEAVVTSTKELIESAGFMMEQSIEPDLPRVMGDLSAISQCLQNLVGNAVKYGGNTHWIGLRAAAGQSQNGAGREVQISVSDRGMGIDRSELSNIFDPFYRSPRVQAVQIHGTGLGLSLAKRISETMGGTLSVVSELSVGSTFILHLQIAEEVAFETAAAQSGSSSHL